MKNKNLSLKGVLVAVAAGFLSMGYCSAITNFHFNIEAVKAIQESLQDDIMPIHFADNGNDFGGFFYFSNGLGNEAEGGAKAPDKTFHKCITGEGPESTITCVETEDECEGTFEPEATAYDSDCSEEVPAPTQDSDFDDYQYKVSILTGGGSGNYICSRQVKGYYYNAERGERLWPLDSDTWSDIVETTGGFYTMCKKAGYIDALSGCLSEAGKGNINYYDCKDQARKLYATDGDGYYGSIKHVFSGQELNLIAGVRYNPDTKFTSIDTGTGFSPTFIRFGNKYPLGFIYDNNGGVGFVGCHVKTNDIKKIITTYNKIKQTNPLDFMFKENLNGDLEYQGGGDVDVICTGLSWDSLIGVVIEGIVGMGEVGNTANFEVIGNQKDDKMQYFSSANINNNTIINYARKKAELLCRGKWKNAAGNLATNDSIICVSGGTIDENMSNEIKNKNKTLIVKNGNVKINPFKSAEINNNNNNKYYDIFIDSGNLIINETESTDKFVIKDNGFVSKNNSGNPKSLSDFNRNVLIDYLHNTEASTSKIEGCISHFQMAMNENGICSGYRTSETEQEAKCVSCEVGEPCYSECGESCGDNEKCILESKTTQIFDNTGCMAYLTKEEGGACQLTGGLDIVMDPNGDRIVNEEDIEFLDNCSANGVCSVGNDVTVASIIKGNFIINGNVLGPDRPDTSFDKKLKNKYFIYGKLSSRDSFQSLQDTFAWRCNNGYTTDDSYCLPTNKERGYNNPYEDAFLVVIDQNYENSPFFSAS